MVNAKKIKTATIWASSETLISIILSIVPIWLFAKILTPNEFGQIATAQFISALLQLILSLGLSEAIIQRKNLNTKDIQTAWFGSILLAILCLIICFIIGIYFHYAKNKTLSYILYIEAINSFLTMIIIVPSALLLRNLEMKSFAYRTIISRFCFLIIALSLAYLNFGLWSIIYANLLQTIIATILIWLASKHLIVQKIYFNKKRFIKLINFGFFVMIESLLWSLVTRVFGLLIAMFHGASALGLYNMATKLTDSITNILYSSIGRIVFPIFSSVQDDKKKLLYMFQASTYYFNLLSMPAFFCMALTSHYWVPIILGEKWATIIPVVQILCVMYGIMYSRMFVGTVIKAVGQSKDLLILSLTSATITICATLFTKNSSLSVVLLTLAIPRIIITIPFGIYLMKKICGFNIRNQLSPIIFPLLISIILLIIIFIIQQIIFSNKAISLLIQFIIAIIIFTIIIFILNHIKKLKY